MRYVTIEQIKSFIPSYALVQLSNDDSAGVTENLAVIEQLVTSAEEEVDGYLRARYTLPLDQVPTLINKLTLQLFRYALYDRRPEGDFPDAVRRGYTDAIKSLEHIAHGKLTLGVKTNGVDLPESGEIRARSSGSTFGTMLDDY